MPVRLSIVFQNWCQQLCLQLVVMCSLAVCCSNQLIFYTINSQRTIEYPSFRTELCFFQRLSSADLAALSALRSLARALALSVGLLGGVAPQPKQCSTYQASAPLYFPHALQLSAPLAIIGRFISFAVCFAPRSSETSSGPCALS